MRRYIQAKMKFSDFCDVQTNIVEYFVENIIYMYFPLFSVLLSNLSITECIFNIIVTSFKYRQFLYQLHIWYCMLPPPPPFWHQFLHLMIQIDTSMFIDTDRWTVKHTNTEKKLTWYVKRQILHVFGVEQMPDGLSTNTG